MKNPQFGIWIIDDDPAERLDIKKSVSEVVRADIPELETVKELRSHRRLLRSQIKSKRDKAYNDFLAGNDNAMDEIGKMENKIKLINQTINQLERK